MPPVRPSWAAKSASRLRTGSGAGPVTVTRCSPSVTVSAAGRSGCRVSAMSTGTRLSSRRYSPASSPSTAAASDLSSSVRRPNMARVRFPVR